MRHLGRPITLHSGLPLANDLLNGRYAFAACLAIFVLKMAATAITFGSGGVGGLFVPTAAIGAALGAAWDAALPGSHGGIYTLLGIAAFAGASYNSLLFAAVFIAEATGNVFLVVPALVASSVAFIATAGISNSRAQRRQRPSAEEELEKIPIDRIMTKRIVTIAPDQSLTAFSHSVLLEHHFKALPVIERDGTLRGMVGIDQLNRVPIADWDRVLVSHIMDARAKVLCPHHTAADAKRSLESSQADYVPIVDPVSYRLVGIVSSTDLFVSIGRSAVPIDRSRSKLS